jgi:UDP-N-acetylmuramate--alanine ligase
VIGAAGAGGGAAALLALWAGAEVSGCDPGGPSPYSAAVEAAGIPMAWRHDAEHVRGLLHPGRLAVTKALTAIDPDHPELAAARALGITVEPWQQLVADAAVGRNLVAVAGTHGKSTSAGWLVHVLVAAGADPSAFVGALLPHSITGGLPATARRGAGPQVVVEADEYAGNFDAYRPNVALLTNLEWDHPDVFADRAAVIDSVERWIRRAEDEGTDTGAALIANVADPGVAELVSRLRDWPGELVATAMVEDPADDLTAASRAIAEEFRSGAGPARVILGRIVAADEVGTTLEIAGLGRSAEPLDVRLATAGRHNAANALGVAATADRLGLTAAAVAAGLATFSGVGRRLERIGEAAGVVVYDDYGHHPTAIRETIRALRQREPDRRLWAVYEPLTYHRTAAFLSEFAEALGTADAVAIAEIWAGRDLDTAVVSASGLADAVAIRRPDIVAAAPGSVDETADWLAGEVRAGDAVLIMGGGRSYQIGPRLLAALEAR